MTPRPGRARGGRRPDADRRAGGVGPRRSRPASDRLQPARRTVVRPAGVGRGGSPVAPVRARPMRAALELAQHAVGHRLATSAACSGSAPSVSGGAAQDEGRAAATQMAAITGAADSGSAGARGRPPPRRRGGPPAASARTRGRVRARRRAARRRPRAWRCTAGGPGSGGSRRARRPCRPGAPAAPTAAATAGSRSRTDSASRRPRRAPVEEEFFLGREVVEHRLDGDVALAGDVGDRHGVEAALGRTAAAPPSGSAPGSAPSCARAGPVVHSPSQHNHGTWSPLVTDDPVPRPPGSPTAVQSSRTARAHASTSTVRSMTSRSAATSAIVVRQRRHPLLGGRGPECVERGAQPLGSAGSACWAS